MKRCAVPGLHGIGSAVVENGGSIKQGNPIQIRHGTT
jgi:hypothetical protein